MRVTRKTRIPYMDVDKLYIASVWCSLWVAPNAPNEGDWTESADCHECQYKQTEERTDLKHTMCESSPSVHLCVSNRWKAGFQQMDPWEGNCCVYSNLLVWVFLLGALVILLTICLMLNKLWMFETVAAQMNFKHWQSVFWLITLSCSCVRLLQTFFSFSCFIPAEMLRFSDTLQYWL